MCFEEMRNLLWKDMVSEVIMVMALVSLNESESILCITEYQFKSRV